LDFQRNREMITAKIKSKLPLLALVVVLILALAMPAILNSDFLLSVLIESGAMVMVALGFAAVFRSGQLSLGQAAFAAVGGYAGGILAAKFSWPFWACLLAGGVGAALVAFLLGIVVLRLGGLYFTIATLALGEITSIIASNWSEVTEGNIGIGVPIPVVQLGALTIDFGADKSAFYYVILLLIVLFALALWRIDNSKLGRIMKSVAVNPTLSEHSGIYLMKYRVIIFTLASFITGVGGSFYVHYFAWAGPSLFTSILSNGVLIMCVIGGLWSLVWGPIIGGVIYTFVGTLMQLNLEGLRPLFFGGVVVLILILMPNGLVDLPYKVPLLMKGLFKQKTAAPAESKGNG
jgi:branched-chain amino acid transport system permease protein